MQQPKNDPLQKFAYSSTSSMDVERTQRLNKCQKISMPTYENLIWIAILMAPNWKLEIQGKEMKYKMKWKRNQTVKYDATTEIKQQESHYCVHQGTNQSLSNGTADPAKPSRVQMIL